MKNEMEDDRRLRFLQENKQPLERNGYPFQKTNRTIEITTNIGCTRNTSPNLCIKIIRDTLV